MSSANARSGRDTKGGKSNARLRDQPQREHPRDLFQHRRRRVEQPRRGGIRGKRRSRLR